MQRCDGLKVWGCGDVDATLIFSATDPDGWSSDEVAVKIHYPVC